MDKQLYSRQIVAFGFNAMNKLSKLRVLIYRIGGLGIEIAKNIILAGPKIVNIFDDNKIKIEDIGSNFYINEKDVDKRKDEVCLPKLKELNNNVQCEILKDKNIEQSIDQYDVIVITDICDLKRLAQLNEICRKNKVGFIISNAFLCSPESIGGSCLWSPIKMIFTPFTIGTAISGNVALLASSIIITSNDIFSFAYNRLYVCMKSLDAQ